tara:strand:- start:17 stop:154 length:138 start_codon:yes stop_codon:yes gene_type:complete
MSYEYIAKELKKVFTEERRQKRKVKHKAKRKGRIDKRTGRPGKAK